MPFCICCGFAFAVSLVQESSLCIVHLCPLQVPTRHLSPELPAFFVLGTPILLSAYLSKFLRHKLLKGLFGNILHQSTSWLCVNYADAQSYLGFSGDYSKGGSGSYILTSSLMVLVSTRGFQCSIPYLPMWSLRPAKEQAGPGGAAEPRLELERPVPGQWFITPALCPSSSRHKP